MMNTKTIASNATSPSITTLDEQDMLWRKKNQSGYVLKLLKNIGPTTILAVKVYEESEDIVDQIVITSEELNSAYFRLSQPQTIYFVATRFAILLALKHFATHQKITAGLQEVRRAMKLYLAIQRP